MQGKSGKIHLSKSDYQLIDFGEGRKLERLGKWIVDRVSPAALGQRRDADCDWSQADVRLDAKGQVVYGRVPSPDWECQLGQIAFKLKLTPFGHVGLFPEQEPNWEWLIQMARAASSATDAPLWGLNLFAYTGGSTLALALTGVPMVHVDASAPAVNWARANAQRNGLSQHPIRWIVDDVRKFVQRELRRGNRYQFIVLDPPTYGHGAGGQRWNIMQHLPELLQNCLELLATRNAGLLLTSHSDMLSETTQAEWIQTHASLQCEQGRLELTTLRGKTLDAGWYVRAASA